MERLMIYIHGKGGNPAEAEHYRPLFPDSDVVGLDYQSCSPREARKEFPSLYDQVSCGYRQVEVIANSIGAYFTLCALSEKNLERTFLISPVVDMERLILKMLSMMNLTEEELEKRKVIPTDYGETLSWEYLCYVREHPIEWNIPTHVLYGGKDTFTSRETITGFVERIGGSLTVMEDGEHWFHTEKQMKFLDRWIAKIQNENSRSH